MIYREAIYGTENTNLLVRMADGVQKTGFVPSSFTILDPGTYDLLIYYHTNYTSDERYILSYWCC